MNDDGIDAALMLDGNAVAGQLQQIFGRDVTTAVARCTHCEREAALAALAAFTQGPGVVLRCRGCSAAIARIVDTGRAIYLDARGAAFIRIAV